jgi:hypothetical protein
VVLDEGRVVASGWVDDVAASVWGTGPRGVAVPCSDVA